MKKLYATILYSGIFFGILLPFNFASAYSVGTHAFLTKEIIDFYNWNFPQSKITGELADYLVDGARMEDNTPRYLNHFYDPVNNRGLADGGFRGQKSKDWAKDSVAQTAFLYRSFSPTEASILSLAQVEKIKSVFDQSDFTWEKAVDLYVDGREEEALFTLGHVIHLVEDMAVPDHVRNDAHPPYDNGGSPYENWTEKFNLGNSDSGLKSRLSGKKPVILGNLNSYFDELATYTNNNFYSADSISKFSSPISETFVNDGNYKYGIKKDIDGSYRLIRSENLSIFSVDYESEKSLLVERWSIDSPAIMIDYWDRLSVKSVQYGAGVIDLFFKEVEKEKQSRVAKPNPSLPTRYFGQVVDLLKDFIPGLGNNSDQNLNLASTINLVNDNPDAGFPASSARTSSSGMTENNNFVAPAEESEFINVQDFSDDSQDEDLIIDQIAQVENNEIVKIDEVIVPVVEKIAAQVCTFATDKSTTHDKLLINEVAWMGGINSANDEWIELRNISGGVLDISGWQLLDKSEQIKLTFGNLKLETGALVLLERTDDDSVLGVKADAIYAGALSNSDEGLRLFDSECNLMDEVIAGGEWPAGDASGRRTMERAPDLSWQTYTGGDTGRGGVSLFGTPKQDNSQPGVASVSSAIVSNNSEVSNNSTPVTDEDSGPKKIIISEIQINGGAGKANYDFIELYNPNSTQVNLNGYRLVKRTKTGTADSSIKSWTIDAYIPAKGYYLWANSDYTAISSSPDVTTSSTISADNGVALRYGAADTGEIIDSVAWGAATNAFIEGSVFPENPVANQSISRQSETDGNDNSVDFIKTLLSPKNSSNSGGFILPVAWSSQSASVVSYPLISEVYPDQTGANADFIELYNSNASGTQALSLAGWSLQVLSANATSTDKITKKNFENGNSIPASGFFLVGIDNFIGGDMSWASGSLNSTDGATIFLVNGTTTISDLSDSRIVDRIAYGSGSAADFAETVPSTMPASGKSLERKAFQSDYCLTAQDTGEFSGNGCDTDDNSADFELRNVPNPQTAQKLPEPRTAPFLPDNFSAVYASTSAKILLSWSASQDYQGATSILSYSISYATSTDSTSSGQATSTSVLKNLKTVSATTTYLFKINDVGTNYEFSILAKDGEGLSSDSATVSISVASPMTDFYFYKDSRPLASSGQATTSKKYLFDFYYGDYPFIPNSYNSKTGGIMVFYLNREASGEIELNSSNHFRPENSDGTVKDGVVEIVYTKCSGDSPSSAGSPDFSLILPGPCGTAGGAENSTLTSGSLEDSHLLLALVKTTDDIIFTDQDFITVGMYSYYNYNSGWETYKPSVLDRTKYFFQNQSPDHSLPELGGVLSLNFDKQISKLEIEWPKAVDTDTLDIFLTYEISYDGGANWQSTGAQNKIQKIVAPGQIFSILVRAKDDFGNYSDPPLTADWSYPATVFHISQIQSNSWSASFGTKNQNCPSCAGIASLQSIQPQENFEFNTVTLRLKQEIVSDTSRLSLAVYPDLNGLPDFSALISEAQLTDMLRPDPDSDIAFTFSNPIALSVGGKYWLVLNVKEYSDSRGYYRNQWQNAINASSNLYSYGQAGKGNSGTCDSYCDFTVPYPDASADWYMKIGFSE